MTKSPRFLSQVNHPVRATIQWCLTPNLPLTKYLWSRLMSCHERHSQRLVALSFPIWFWNIFSWLKYWANQKIYQMNKGVCDAFLVLYWCQRDCEFSKGVSIKIRLFVESAYWPIYFQDVLDKCILNTSLCDVVFKWLLQEVSYRAQTANFSVAVIFLLDVWADWKARSSENMLASWRAGDWTPECCCKQSPEKNHWGILKHCSMSHLIACPKHSASKINRSTDFSGSKVQKQRARWNWHHIAHSSDGGWIYIWSMFFLIFLEYLFYWWKIYQRWGVVGKAVGNAGQMEGHENSKDRPSKSWQLSFRRTLERLGLHPTSKRWPKNQQNHTLLLMLQPLDISTLGWSLKRKLARVVLDDSI